MQSIIINIKNNFLFLSIFTFSLLISSCIILKISSVLFLFALLLIPIFASIFIFPRTSLIFLPLSFLLQELHIIKTGLIGSSLTNAIIIAVFLSALLNGFLIKKFRELFDKYRTISILLLILLFLNLYSIFRGGITTLEYSGLISYIRTILLFWFPLIYVNDSDDLFLFLKVYLLVVLIASFFSCLFSIAPKFYFLGRLDEYRITIGPIHTGLTRTNAFFPGGSFGVFTLIGGQIFFMSCFQKHALINSKIKGIFFSLLYIFAVFVSYSRSTWLSYLVSCLIFLATYIIYKKGKKQYTIVVLSVLIPILIFFAVFYFGNLYKVVYEIRPANVHSRLILDRIAFMLFLKSPIWGQGYIDFQDITDSFLQREFSPHNSFTARLMYYGILGFIPFIIIVILKIFYLIKTMGDYHFGIYSIAFFSGLCGILIESYFFGSGEAFLWLFLGSIGSLYLVSKKGIQNTIQNHEYVGSPHDLEHRT